jgi:hypothetical protein
VLSYEVIDAPLQRFRRKYREFYGSARIEVDKSYFSIYNDIDTEIRELEKPFIKLQIRWNKTCEILLKPKIDAYVTGTLNKICSSTDSLIKGASVMHEKALVEFFSGDIVDESLPMKYIRALDYEIEERIELVWKPYLKEKDCVGSTLNNIISSFDSYIESLTNISVIIKSNLTDEFAKSKKSISKSITYVKNFMKDAKNCYRARSLNVCLRVLVKIFNLMNYPQLNIYISFKLVKEMDCEDSCGRLFASIRSAIFSVTETVKRIYSNYKTQIYEYKNIEEIVNSTFTKWTKSTESFCNLSSKGKPKNKTKNVEKLS